LRDEAPSEIIARRVNEACTYAEHAELIESVLSHICRRHHLSPVEADDFCSTARLKLVDNDYEVLRKFEGRSTIRTFLTVVLERAFLDFRNSQWGKWRPSAEAQRLGGVALRLEQLLARDGHTFDEAVELLHSQFGVRESRDELYAISVRLPLRTSRKPQGEEAISHVEDPGVTPDALLAREELRPRAAAVRAALERAMNALDAQDRLIIRLKFEDGLGVVDIAEMLHVAQRPLYRRIDQILKRLRSSLETQGFGPSEAGSLLSEAWSDLAGPRVVEATFGKPKVRPSMY
jgi:RNA polymerase sigma factor (sigma-70 family)